jgi:tetratricopeptide (TPR) repeat protein
MRSFLLIFALVWAGFSLAQSSDKYNSVYASFYRAEDLFQKEQYSAARNEFRTFISTFSQKNDPLYIKALYYEGIAALELYNNDAIKLLEDFNKNYPESIYRTKIYLKIGKYYYQKKDYKTALLWFEKLNDFEIDTDEKEEYYFKVGYAHFLANNYEKAKFAFYIAKEGTSQYAAPSLYYYSHISYENKAYQTALEGFEKLLKDSKFGVIVPYYITQIYYFQGKYDEITRFAPAMLDSTEAQNKSNMQLIIGDAFYRVGKYDEAVPFLEAYNKKEKTTRIEDYQLAYAYFKSGDYPKAIQLFDRVSQRKDSLAQVSFYHVAECYLQQGNNAYARKAFEAASLLNHDKKIQEDALYNFAILSYRLDVNPYDEALEALTLYLEKYPNSDRKNEVYQYLVNVYTSINNYEAAMVSLDKLVNKDFRLRTAYQIVAYNRGVELYQRSDYKASIEAFKKVDKYPIDTKLSAQARYWTADAMYRLKNYKSAILEYKNFLNLPGAASTDLRHDAYYNIAYSHFMQEEYQLAVEAFRSYLLQNNLKSIQKQADATMRIADSYFVLRNDEQAINFYKQTLEYKLPNQDKALFYLAKSYGFTNSGSQNKINTLQDIVNNHPRSKYIVTSIYEIALEYRFLEQDEKALTYFYQLEKDFPSSPLVKEAILNCADIHYKKRDYPKAEAYFKRVLDAYGSDREICADAVKGLVNIFKAQKQPERVDEIIGKYSCSEFTVDEQEEIYYNSALEPYLDSSFVEAIPELQKYIGKFPKGKYTLEVKAYLANSFYRTKQAEKAMDLYKEVAQGPQTDFTEIAAVRLSRHYYNGEQYKEALPYYLLAEKSTSQPSIIANSRVGLMRCYFIVEEWQKAEEYAKKVLANTQTSNTIKLEAEFVQGISAFHLESFEDALIHLGYVTKNSSSVFAAESYYYIAKIHFLKDHLDQSETEIRNILKMKPAFDFWIAKGLMLQTRVLIRKNDLFQAEHTLKSVIDNYPNSQDGILLEANQLWDELLQLKNKPKTGSDKTPTEIEIKTGKKK